MRLDLPRRVLTQCLKGRGSDGPQDTHEADAVTVSDTRRVVHARGEIMMPISRDQWAPY